MAGDERRPASEMTADEIDVFLDSERTLVLVTLRKDGSPIAHPMWFAKLGNAIYINTQRNSLKSRNIMKDARTCLVVEAGEAYFELRGVRIEGHCEEVTDEAESDRAQAAQAEKDERIGSGMREMPSWFSQSRQRRLGRGDRVIFRIPMDRVYSWDFSKLRDHYAEHAPDATGGESL